MYKQAPGNYNQMFGKTTASHSLPGLLSKPGRGAILTKYYLLACMP